ncbi:MAG: GspE/PulE family protein [Vicinamibacterales bacterium]
MLCRLGVIRADQLAHALASQAGTRLPLGRILVDRGYASDLDVQRGVADQHGVPLIDLERAPLDRDLARLIGRAYARRHDVLPVARRPGALVVAMTRPGDRGVIDDLRQMTGARIEVVTASSLAMQRAFRRLYDAPVPAGDAAGVAGAGGPAGAGVAPASLTGAVAEGDGDAADATAGRPIRLDEADRAATFGDAAARRADDLLRQLIGHALASRCSDLHLEMLGAGLGVRYRIDGVLHPPHFGARHEALDRHAREIVSRLKVLCRLDIAERRRPQDGSFRFDVTGDVLRALDLRVSFLPTRTGESVVVRLLDATRAPQSIQDLDLSPAVAAALARVLGRTAGLFLVTGPTGSGKSTTLHACLRRLHRPGIRILTAEDPVEYVYDGLSQCEVNDDIGNTFARYLRAFLRHDPEVIMVGEIRDEETARMAFRAAQTGHLLLSTLHTNSAIAALPRLRDLGIPASLIAQSLAGVMSQRLVRRRCPACAAPAGCPRCGFTGFHGRLIVADLWVPDEEDAILISRDAPADEIRRSAARTTIRMVDDARSRLTTGATTAEELARVLPPDVLAELDDGSPIANVAIANPPSDSSAD